MVEARTVAEIATALNERYPGVYDRLMEPDGSLRRYVNIFVEGDDGRWQGSADTQVDDGRQVWIVPNIAGGGLRIPREPGSESAPDAQGESLAPRGRLRPPR